MIRSHFEETFFESEMPSFPHPGMYIFEFRYNEVTLATLSLSVEGRRL